MNFQEFVIFIRKWKGNQKFPTRSSYPEQINIHSKIWEDITRLYRYTETDRHEYESSFFYIENDVIISKPLKGSKENVHAHHSLQVKFVPDNHKKRYERQILLDGKIIQKDYFAPDKLPEKIDAGFLFNVHTHPMHTNHQGDKVYTFFSPTDINSLFKVDTLLTGLVTNELWLACKTDQVISKIGSVGVEMLNNISRESLANGNKLEEVLKEEIRNWGLVIYRGEFNKPLIKVI